MWATNLKIVAVVLGTIAVYTLVANLIPQVQSEVPKELSFTGEVSAAQLVEAGQQLYEGAGGCTACHGLGTRAPNLLTDEAGQGTIGQRCGTRVEGEDCKAYLHHSLVDPHAYVVEGYQPIMPDMGKTLSPTQIWSLVAFLESQGGEVTVTAADLQEAGSTGGGAGAAPAGGAAASGSTAATADPRTLIDQFGCLACHRLGSEGQDVGPPFTDVGKRHDAAYIRRSILEPNAEVAKGYEKFAGVMPQDFGQRMTAAQLEALVAFLSAQKGG